VTCSAVSIYDDAILVRLCGSQVRPTAGVSYVLKTTSNQQDSQRTPLPHTVIQPPNLQEVADAAVDRMLESVLFQVLTALFPRICWACK
jgi:hypothetical protein